MAETVHVLADGDGNLFAIPHKLLVESHVPDADKAQVKAAIGGTLDPAAHTAIHLAWRPGPGPAAFDDKPDKPKPDPPKGNEEIAFDKKPDPPKGWDPNPPGLDPNTLELRSLGAFRMEAPAVVQQNVGH
jgi:hypothetical protein